MNPFSHRFCNGELLPAAGDEDAVVPLPVQKGLLGDMVVTRSFWKPTAIELALLQSGGCVMLQVCGRTHPPLRIDVVPE